MRKPLDAMKPYRAAVDVTLMQYGGRSCGWFRTGGAQTLYR
jgi:hypothetical protein